jgi:mannobiose 2-epimerase
VIPERDDDPDPMPPVSPAQTADYARRIEDDLRGNILPFWTRHVANRGARGFFGSLTNDLVVDPAAERGALLSSRILWTYSAAYGRYRDPDYLAMAELAHDDLMAHFHDRRNGGFWWSIAADGTVLRDRKQIYGQAFAVYALAEYHAATGLGAPLEAAIGTYRLIEAHARERHGGYLEAFGPAWEPIADMRLSGVDLNEPKSQNTHLHIMEAYTRLLAVWPDPALRGVLHELVGIMLGRIVDPRAGHLGLFFAEDWEPRSDRVSYGHDIEAAWLLMRAAEVLGDPALEARIRPLAVRIAEATLAEGVDSDGGVYNQGGPGGLTDTNKEWWPQAEAVIGFLEAHRISGEERFLKAALRTWDFIEQRLIDRGKGEWLRGVTREGRVLDNELKVSFWKCPYHNGRAGLEAVRRLRALEPVR